MLMIRLARFGGKKSPTYRVVVIDKERARDSRAVEVVGIYNPLTEPAAVRLDHARIDHWMKNGAQPSVTVARLMKANPVVAAAPSKNSRRPRALGARVLSRSLGRFITRGSGQTEQKELYLFHFADNWQRAPDQVFSHVARRRDGRTLDAVVEYRSRFRSRAKAES